jgi:cyclopropane fatty-acyl-phospholipid synthase-like methyltransferase
MDLPRSFIIRESGSRILDPLDDAKLAALGRALRLPRGTRVLDLACGKGEMLCTWARDLGFEGVGVDVSTDFVAAAVARARVLDVADAAVGPSRGRPGRTDGPTSGAVTA